MPLPITIPGRDMYDEKTGRFITTKETHLVLEHSLLSISKWEMKWHKPYLSKDPKTNEENIDYLRCMCLTQGVDPNVFLGISADNVKEVAAYISNPMTATTFHTQDKRPSREIITNELVYYWMTELGIPFDPCQKWHFNRLMTLIQVASLKKQPPKKMGRKEMLSERALLNAQRKAKYNTHG